MTVGGVAFCAIISVFYCTVDANCPVGVVGELHVAVLAGVTLRFAIAFSASNS